MIISATDQPIVHSQSLLTAELLRKLGLNVELQAGDWGTLITRRTSKEPVEKGGWSIFHTVFVAAAVELAGELADARSGDNAWFGWPTDKKLEELREAWFNTADAAAAKKAADAVQLEAFKFVPYIPTAQFIIPTAYRSNLSGADRRAGDLPLERREEVSPQASPSRAMIAYILRRLGATFIVMAVVALFVFSLLFLTPGDPAAVIAGDIATDDDIKNIRAKLGLDEPFLVQFGGWVWRLLHGDLGTSIFTNLPVTTLIGQRVQPTVSLTLCTLIVAVLIAVPLGVVAAARAGTWVDRLVMGFSVLGFSVPVFVLAYMLIIVFSVQLEWLPVQGYRPIGEGFWPWLSHLILPSIALGTVYMALIARITRAAMLDVLSQDYIRTANAKGLAPRAVLTRHALKNAGVPIITVIGIGIALLISGAIVTETVFAIPGIGRLTVDAILRRDYPIIQGVILLFSGGVRADQPAGRSLLPIVRPAHPLLT